MGGGGGGQNTNTMQNSNAIIPDWLSAAGQSAVGQAQQLSAQPYTPYTGQTVAGFDPMQQQSFGQVQNLQGFGMPQYNAAAGAMGNMLGSVNPLTPQQIQQNANQLYGGYNANVMAPASGLLGGYLGGPATGATAGANAQQMMSPYASSVIAPTMALGQQALASNLQSIGAGANQAGAFGGSRQGVMEGMAQSQAALNEQNTLGQMLNTGWNSALPMAGQLAAQQGAQGYNAANQLAGMYQTGYGNAQTIGQNIGTTNLSQGMTAAQQLPGMMTSAQSALMGQNAALYGAGQQQQQYQQNLLNAGYGQFMAQQAWPYQQLQTYLSAIGGIPYSTSNYGQTQEAMPSNLLGQGIGGAAALAGGVGSILNSNTGNQGQ